MTFSESELPLTPREQSDKTRLRFSREDYEGPGDLITWHDRVMYENHRGTDTPIRPAAYKAKAIPAPLAPELSFPSSARYSTFSPRMYSWTSSSFFSSSVLIC